MSYSKNLELFISTHTYKKLNVNGAVFRYVLSGENFKGRGLYPDDTCFSEKGREIKNDEQRI